jgi:hypothetical protein
MNSSTVLLFNSLNQEFVLLRIRLEKKKLGNSIQYSDQTKG